MGRVAPGILLVVLLLPTLLVGASALGAAPERRLVSFEDEAPAAGSLLARNVRVLEAFPFARVALVEGAPGDLHALARMSGIAGVYKEEAVELHVERARGIVNANPPADAAGKAAWPSGEGVTVALVDSGLDEQHPAFAGRVAANVKISRAGGVSSANGDDEGHGTHVAGILAGDGAGSRDNRFEGFAPGARVVGVDISDAFTTTSAVRAFAWIHENRHAHDIRVVSNSWGREKEGAHYDADDPVIRATDALVADGIVVVFSAGNRGRDGTATLTPEGMNPNVLTVGSASAQGRREAYSSQGPATDASGATLAWTKPDVMAPGSSIVSTRSSLLAPSGSPSDEERYYIVMNGTSMAAPQAAAAAGLLLARHPELSPQMVIAVLQGTARDLGPSGVDDETGYGMLDVGGALHAADLLLEGERRVIVERQVPVRLAGSVAAASGLVVLSGDAPTLPPAEEVALPLALPEGAASARLAFNWSGPGEFVVMLEGEGRSVAFEPVGARRLVLAEPVEPGRYQIVVKPTGVAAHTTFTVEGSILVREERVVEVPGEFHARPFSAQGGFYLPEDSASRVLSIIGQAPLLGLALMSGVACIVGLKWRGKRS